jgi:hypothetical protein
MKYLIATFTVIFMVLQQLAALNWEHVAKRPIPWQPPVARTATAQKIGAESAKGKSSFTRGPWVYDPKEGTVSAFVPKGDTGDTDFLSGFEVAIVTTNYWQPAVVKANGRLIAGSPKLYEFVLRRAQDGDQAAEKTLDSLGLNFR